MKVSAVNRRLNSHVYFCVLFTLLSFSLLPMIASLAGILSGRTAVREIHQQPDKYYGHQVAWVCIYASFVSATLWLCMILTYVVFSFKNTLMVS